MSSSLAKKIIRITNELRFTCPFCAHRRTFTVGYADGGQASGRPVALHDMPYCEQFKKMDLLEYLRAARLAGAEPVGDIPS
jgi:hypothetical protein